MREIGDVQISRGIVHIVDHHQSSPVLSDVELELAGAAKLVAYFAAQVRNALSDTAAGAADFKAAGSGAGGLCNAILAGAGPDQFVPRSRQLAELLFQAMGNDQRISAGSLAVCMYSGSNVPGESFLALLKIDPSEMLVQTTQPLGKGLKLVTFDVVENVMPTAKERLQKAALVRQHGKGEYDLLLLDRQTEKLAATFFADAFLGAQQKLDEVQHTRALYLGLQAASTQMINSGVLPRERAEWFRREIDSAVTRTSFDLPEWLQELRLPEAAPDVIREELGKRLGPDQAFSLSDEVGRQLAEKRRVRGDFGVLLEVESAHYDEVVKDAKELEDGRLLRLTLEIRNPKWGRK